jgi:AraC-like DNA-binding protein
MTADGSGTSSGSDERGTADTAATGAARRRRRFAARRPGVRASRPYRGAADRPAAPETAPCGDTSHTASTPAPGMTAPHHVHLGPACLSVLSPPLPPGVTQMQGGGNAGASPRTWYLVFAPSGPLALGRGGLPVRLEQGSVMLWEPSESLRLSADAVGRADPVLALILHLPEAALPLPGEVLHSVSGRAAPTGSGPAALLTSYVRGLAAQSPTAGARHRAWLGAAAVHLAVAFLDHETARPHAGRPGPHLRATVDARRTPASEVLLHDIKAYIENHLADSTLSPTAIAAANHISLRYLHHLFRRESRTVGAFLRERRLERCCAELSDPGHAHRSVCEIARRSGFHDPAVFNRTFKGAYGITPGAYRKGLVPASIPGTDR